MTSESWVETIGGSTFSNPAPTSEEEFSGIGAPGDYLEPTAGAFVGAVENVRQDHAEASWEAFLNRVGGDVLGISPDAAFDFPGMDLEAPYTKFGTPKGVFGIPRWLANLPEPWRYPQMGTMETYRDPRTGELRSTWVRYDPRTADVTFREMTAQERGWFYEQAVASNLLPKAFKGETEWTMEGTSVFQQLLAEANIYGKSLKDLFGLYTKQAQRSGGGGRRAPSFKAEVPDYETLLQNAKELIRQQLGRDPRDWEISLIADEMKRQYGAWAASAERMTLGGNGVYEIPDPMAKTQAFFEEKYAPEIQRLQTRAETQANNRLFMDNLTRGSEAMASSPTYGGPLA